MNLMRKNLIRLATLSLLALSTFACRSVDDRPEGWSEESHGNDVPAAYATVFDLEKVHRLDLIIDDQVFAEMRQDASISVALDRDPMWVEATVSFNEKTWQHVGMRFKGNSTIEDAMDAGSEKFPFRLTFDKFEDQYTGTKNQRFYGFKKLAFASNSEDDSQLHEVLASELFQSFGVPSPRAAFYQVFVDKGKGPEYFGLYTALEDPSDNAFIAGQLMSNDGLLFEAGGPGADWVNYSSEGFEQKTHETTPDQKAVEAAIEVLNSDSADKNWRKELEASFDVPGFLRFLAMNTVMVNGDSYGCKARNYSLFASAAEPDLLRWIPEDLNEAFVGTVASCGKFDAATSPDSAESLFFEPSSSDWPLISRVLADEEYRDEYAGYLEEALSGLFEEKTFKKRATALHDMIRPYVVGDEGEVFPYSNLSSQRAFEEALDSEGGLFDHVEYRHRVVKEALGL